MLDDLIVDCLIRHGVIPPEVAALSFAELLTVVAARERLRTCRDEQEDPHEQRQDDDASA